MGTKWPSCPPLAAANRVRLTREKLSWDWAYAQVANPTFGGVVIFSGVVRNTEKGEPIHSITYEIYLEMAARVVARIIEEAEERFGVVVSVQHRFGLVPVGETSFLVACAGEHREEAFAACRYVVDQVKQRTPIWKAAFEWEEGP